MVFSEAARAASIDAASIRRAVIFVGKLLLLLGEGSLSTGQFRLLCAQRLLRGSLLLKLGLERLEFALLAAGAAGQMRKFFFDIFQVFRNRGSQKLHLLMLLRAAQNLILRFAELAADGSEFKFGLCSSRGSLRGLRLERFRAFSECFAFFREFCKRIGAGQNARALCGGAAGHAAACRS